MIGTGALAPQLIRVHAKVRPIAEVAIWGRRPEQAEALARELAAIAAAGARPADRGTRRYRPQGSRRPRPTSSPAPRFPATPLVEGDWLREGQHIDLVGAYTPADARKRRQGGAARAGLCRHPRRRPEGGRRHRPAAGQRHDRRGRRDRRPVRAGARPADRPAAGRRRRRSPCSSRSAPRWRTWRRPSSR